MTLFDLGHTRDNTTRDRLGAAWKAAKTDAFSTALFTGLNIAVFLILTASVVGAAVLYSQGA